MCVCALHITRYILQTTGTYTLHVTYYRLQVHTHTGSIPIYIYTYTDTHTHTSAYIYTNMCISIYRCIYIYII